MDFKYAWWSSHWLWMHRDDCCPWCLIDGVIPDGSVPHPLALGQYVNHPPAGTRPNLMYFGLFACTPEEAAALRDVEPLLPVARSGNRSAVALMLALRDIHDEEAFADYALAPPRIREALWYSPVQEPPCEAPT
eukprot:TRINITY_DN7477_c0_g1_i1.p1 TRINITY_DN7477_c0_g1~~TRINITY_DN7477_c0_g1_i1.p1  ORF type:complete len:134 (+),score=22.81 TRINITY_DN7477_c0_g1_i1:614-1015(+)